MLLILAIGFGWAVKDARQSIRQEATASVGLALGLIDAALAAGDFKQPAIQQWITQIQKLDRIRHLKIATSLQGALAQETSASSGAGAQAPGWFRWAVASEPVVVVREVQVGSGHSVSIYIASSAGDEVLEAWDETRGFLMLLGILALAIYLSVHLIAGRAFRPVARILHGLLAIEEGDYETRLPEWGSPELDRLSQGINHLSQSLGESRKENRALTRHSLTIQEDERRTLAQELHDEFGQNLTAIKMMSAALQGDSPASTRAAVEIQHLCDRLFGVVRLLMRRLRPMVLDDLGLFAALEDLSAHWRITAPALSITIECDETLKSLKGEPALEIYRIIQEALTNTIRHAGATRTLIRIARGAEATILLRVQDNGVGMGHATRKRGFGLLGMRERVASLQGQFKLVTNPDEGFEIRITLPAERV